MDVRALVAEFQAAVEACERHSAEVSEASKLAFRAGCDVSNFRNAFEDAMKRFDACGVASALLLIREAQQKEERFKAVEARAQEAADAAATTMERIRNQLLNER